MCGMKWHIFAQTSTMEPWASCQIRKIAGAHAPGMPGTFSPSLQACDPDMHHGTCVTHVPWCMPGSLTCGFLWNRRRGRNVPGIPGACAICNIRYLVRGPLRLGTVVDELFHPTICWPCDYSSMLGLKFNYVGRRIPMRLHHFEKCSNM